jgi:peptidoglycan/LPS O-acetylase OafA/YrhL
MLSRENNFDALRLYAALAVLWSHTVPLTQGSERNELLFRWSGGQTTTGTLAVFVFFSMSGYLISRSYERAPSPWQYTWARILRILPALIVVVALLALVIGPIVSTLPASEYFRSPDPYHFVAVKCALLFGESPSLPGVWEHNPLPAINGALWTLRYEARFYGVILLLGIAGLLRKHIVLGLYLLVMTALVFFPGDPGTPDFLPDPNNNLDVGAAFLAGALIQQWNLPLNGKIATACALFAALGCATGQMLWVQRTVVPYLVLYLAVAPSVVRLPRLRSGVDISYGLYLWAWPISQLVVSHMAHPNWLTLGLIVTPLALACGWLSWHLVEKRALAFKATAPKSVAELESGPDEKLRLTPVR